MTRVCFCCSPFACPSSMDCRNRGACVAGDRVVVDWLHATAANLHILSWGRSFGSSGSSGRHVTQASPWLTLDTDNKCVSAVLRHPGCSSSCSMLLHMAVSGACIARTRMRRCL